MNKQELIEFVITKTGLEKKDSAHAVDAVLAGIVAGLKENTHLRLVGFGSFNIQATAARKGRNPRTKEEVDIPAGNRITFKAGKEFKAAFN